MDFTFSQFLFGHGRFGEYLTRFSIWSVDVCASLERKFHEKNFNTKFIAINAQFIKALAIDFKNTLCLSECLRCGRFSQFPSILGCESEIFFLDRKLQ
ncbi:hypothetical protein DERF_011529 [Dermatophagoides farinae]|uniref:Uncharacterized protein n=1 Tax=Dermatophagoides farinae TaxID=6954 RepID=A0A922L362_DERFA|nr:hypothetical protein DERF_011529 [Dermatophagoides farinae]